MDFTQTPQDHNVIYFVEESLLGVDCMVSEGFVIPSNNFPLLSELLWIDKYVQSNKNVLVSDKSFFNLLASQKKLRKFNSSRYILIDL